MLDHIAIIAPETHAMGFRRTLRLSRRVVGEGQGEVIHRWEMKRTSEKVLKSCFSGFERIAFQSLSRSVESHLWTDPAEISAFL